jgi:hypothetical protein
LKLGAFGTLAMLVRTPCAPIERETVPFEANMASQKFP